MKQAGPVQRFVEQFGRFLAGGLRGFNRMLAHVQRRFDGVEHEVGASEGAVGHFFHVALPRGTAFGHLFLDRREQVGLFLVAQGVGFHGQGHRVVGGGHQVIGRQLKRQGGCFGLCNGLILMLCLFDHPRVFFDHQVGQVLHVAHG